MNQKRGLLYRENAAGELCRDMVALGKWLFLGVLIGLILGCAGSAFAHTLSWAAGLRHSHPWTMYTLPVGGLLIVLLYRACRNTSDKGTNTVVMSIQESTDIPLRMAPLIFISTTITQLCGGSAGREGAALQLGGSIGKKLGRILRLGEDSQKILVMCGMSAGFSALFGTPMAAAVFSLEMATVGVMRYGALVPCVTASLTAWLTARFFQVPPEVFPVAAVPDVGAISLLKVVLLAAAAGAVSIGFCLLLHEAEHLYEKYIRNQYLRIALAGVLLIALTHILGTHDYLGSGMGLIEHIFHGEGAAWYAFALKMLFTAVTLGAGFKGGEIVPSFAIGAALGFALSAVLGLPGDLAAACGMLGLFCGVTNSPITSLLIGFELFGFAGMPYYLVTVAVSYLLSGYESLYRKQKILMPKTRSEQ